MQINKLNLK